MGGVADYSGSFVLEVATSVETTVSVREGEAPAAAGSVTLSTAAFGAETVGDGLTWLRAWQARAGSLPLSERLAQVRAYLEGRPRWVLYVFGSLAGFVGGTGWVPAQCCLHLTVASSVPLSQGVSSSASIEVAVLRALRAFSGAALDDIALAHLGQRVENYVVGAPCGLMDQLASSLGRAGQVLPILCRPDVISPLVPLPAGTCVVGWPSGAEHTLDGASPYGIARTASFMAKKVLEATLGRKLGHLAQLQPSEVAAVLNRLPESISGADFLAAHGGVDDALSTVEPGRTYALRAGALFPVQESFRCEACAQWQKGGCAG